MSKKTLRIILIAGLCLAAGSATRGKKFSVR